MTRDRVYTRPDLELLEKTLGPNSVIETPSGVKLKKGFFSTWHEIKGDGGKRSYGGAQYSSKELLGLSRICILCYGVSCDMEY